MKNHYIIRKKRPDNIEILRNIMSRSLAIWDYSVSQIEQVVKQLEITPEFLDKSVCYVAELNGEIKGFFCIAPSQNEELSEAKFYIEPDSIRAGLGTLLWNKVIFELRNEGVKYFKFLSDENARGFYEKLGAVQVAQQSSEIIEGSMIPIMKYTIIEN